MNTRSKTHGFSLVELVIVVVIIGIIAAIAVPRISRGAKGAGDAATRATLAGVRNAIDMYAAEHGGAFPDGADQAEIESKMTQKTDFDGTVNASGDFGPYLRSGFPAIPVGSNKGDSDLLIETSGDPTPDASTAWAYSTDTGKFMVNLLDAEVDENGAKYNSY
ncbi:MAG: prepilin-type N-terminal cleavage/methylation domain-containing protein [Planctomycetes bacterium]|nr:prepilin-type N-terminal cleavage/methylation domain-containing protein [Planctomycetota bacterium]